MSLTIAESVNYDVVIVGAGSGGCGAAYALKDCGYKVALIDRNTILGGNATAAWVDTWLQGMIPSYLEQIILDFNSEMTLNTLRDGYWLRGQFSQQGETKSLLIDKDKLSQRYKNDLDGKIDSFLSFEFILANVTEGIVDDIVIKNMNSGEFIRLKAKYFIDASADGVLCRSNGARIGVDYLCGRDAAATFNEANAQKDVSTPELKDLINEPSLFYEIKNGVDDSQWLDPVTSVYANLDNDDKITSISKPPYITADGYGVEIINPMTGEGTDAYEMVIENAFPLNYEIYKMRMLEHWKYVKLGCLQAYEQNGVSAKFHAYPCSLRNCGFTGNFAPFIGIRESYRIVCDYMMRQSDLTTLITSSNVENNRYVGETSHPVDFHITTGFVPFDNKEKTGFNQTQLRPCGIRYDSVIPQKLKNVLIASRCYGASQIFLASGRGNFSMAYLGFSVGNAIRICMEQTFDDVRKVDIALLQSDKYSQFASRVNILEGLYNETLKGSI